MPLSVAALASFSIIGRSYPAAVARASIESSRSVTEGDMALLIAGSIDAVIGCE
jgi:hypothetical protein